LFVLICSAGQERFKTITHNYYRGAHGIALVYDVTQQASFDNIRKWIADVHAHAESSVNIVLIGNKCDLTEKKVVETEKGKELAKEYGIQFFETSAKADINVQEAFTALVKQVCDRIFAEPTTGGKKGKENEGKETVELKDGKPSKGCGC
jgi:Ras-related protein Rab-8A